MPVPYVSRSEWTSKPNHAVRQEGPRKGVAVHWPGFRFTLGKHADCLGLVARLEREAISSGKYTAIPYNQLACPHGHLIDGRGANRRSAANGNATVNDQWGSVCGLVPVGGKPTDAMLLAIRAALAEQAKGGKLVTHNAVRPEPTQCPGPALTDWVHRGAPAPHQPAQRTHVVREGDTLWGLALQLYGDGAAWTKIAKANDLSGTDIAPGDKLVIP